MVTFLIAGMVFGLSAGFSPGPLLTLVISQTLKHGVKEGTRVALAPLVTDLPIILIALFVLKGLKDSHALLSFVSMAGALFVFYLAYESLQAGELEPDVRKVEPRSLSKGAIVNALNPHPYLFWFTVGGPMLIKAWRESPAAATLFIAGFYVCLVGAKIALTLLIGKSRQWLLGKPYRVLMKILGAMLLLFALLLLRDGLRMVG
jgi:threonine/homoserine/homoserine lactone efflux protein